jgi:serine/threonine protein kinase/tetratricopeptide (TPR) repeat protein
MNTPQSPVLPSDPPDPEDVLTVRNLAGSQVFPQNANLDREGLNEELARTDPAWAGRLRHAMNQLPVVGDWFAGFELVAVLGRGAFGRVYLARQEDLAERFVALKVSADLTGESRTLARLQHTNIVPIYSIHRVAPFQAVCMPYFGATTLAHLLARYRKGQSLPTSGRQLVDTLCVLNDQTAGPTAGVAGGGSSRGTGGSASGSDTLTASERERVETGTLPPRAGTQGFLGLLRSMTYTDAVCWIGTQLADALGHAHAQGLVHNDLKPANVLLTDDGQPMLLDFGIAEDLAVRASAPVKRIGGTLPFMAPEHLDSLQSGTPATDPRSDIYGLGIILFELLTGHHPFRYPTDKTEVEIPRMLAERRAGTPRVRQFNAAVTPGLEAIIRKCLEPDPARRYQSATDVRDDLERHRTDQPLRHARVPSIRERTAKWARRHPHLTSNLSLATAALVVIGLLATGLHARGVRLERYEATAAARGLDDDLQVARYMLNTRTADAKDLGVGVGRCEAALARYGLPADAEWDRRPAFQALSAEEQQRVRARLTDACVFLARGYALRAAPGADGTELLGRAVEFNALAERVAGDDVPRVVWEQRAGLLRRQGKPSEAEQAAARGKQAPLRTGRDYYLSGTEALADGRHREAAELLARAVELEPADYWAHMALGGAHEALAKYPAAAGCYDTTIALQPDLSWGHYNRGRVAVRVWDYEKARTCLDRAAKLAPDHAETYLHRALALQGLRDYDAALADLDRAVEHGAPKARAALLRVRVLALSGKKEAAKQELDEAMKLEPTDEITWLTRGSARMDTDLPGALKDLDAALGINPRSLTALMNKSTVLSRLGRTDDAIRVLDRLLELYPDYTPARAGRGVQHGRKGNWELAKADAEEAHRQDNSPKNVFQVAGIYAHLTKHDPIHKAEAIRLLSSALRGGFGYEHIERDTDLTPIRDTAEFRRLVDGVRLISATGR